VIDGRSAAANFFQGLESEKTSQRTALAQQNHTHQFFTDVLERVKNLLEPKVRKGSPTPDKNQSHSHGFQRTEVPTNLFELLDVEDTAMFDDAESVPVCEQSASKPSNVEHELNIGESDRLLAMWAFVEECTDLRAIVENAWIAFYDGKISIVAAMQTTDATLLVSQHVNHMLAAAYPDMAYAETVFRIVNQELVDIGAVVTPDEAAAATYLNDFTTNWSFRLT